MLQMMSFRGDRFSQPDLRMHCPSCHHLVRLLATVDADALLLGDDEVQVSAGIRLCPNSECCQLLFVAYDDNEIVVSYPPERIDFDATNLPDRILTTLEEAISCHAVKCYTAAGIMVRKTLEELCEDRQAEGPTLQKRIVALKDKVVIPDELLDGLDDLRLLGNDAAHIEAKTYQQVGREEVEISLEFTKEILKAVYQYSDLLSRLRSLRKPPTP